MKGAPGPRRIAILAAAVLGVLLYLAAYEATSSPLSEGRILVFDRDGAAAETVATPPYFAVARGHGGLPPTDRLLRDLTVLMQEEPDPGRTFLLDRICPELKRLGAALTDRDRMVTRFAVGLDAGQLRTAVQTYPFPAEITTMRHLFADIGWCLQRRVDRGEVRSTPDPEGSGPLPPLVPLNTGRVAAIMYDLVQSRSTWPTAPQARNWICEANGLVSCLEEEQSSCHQILFLMNGNERRFLLTCEATTHDYRVNGDRAFLNQLLQMCPRHSSDASRLEPPTGVPEVPTR